MDKGASFGPGRSDEPASSLAANAGSVPSAWRAAKAAAIATALLACFVGLFYGSLRLLDWLFGFWGLVAWLAALVFCALWFVGMLDERHRAKQARQDAP